MKALLERIVSGAQTGADRAALDWAISRGITHGGWCPKGRLAEDGAIDGRYHLQETVTTRYSQRTEWNVSGIKSRPTDFSRTANPRATGDPGCGFLPSTRSG